MHETVGRITRDRTAVRVELERRARARHVVTYGELAAAAGLSTVELMPILAAVRAEDARRCRPDLGSLAVAVRTGLPSGVGPEGRDGVIAAQETVFAAWAGAR